MHVFLEGGKPLHFFGETLDPGAFDVCMISHHHLTHPPLPLPFLSPPPLADDVGRHDSRSAADPNLLPSCRCHRSPKIFLLFLLL